MSNYIDLPVQGGGSGAGVSSVNSATGALTLVGGGTTTVTTVGQTITISSTGGGSGTVTSVGLSLPAMFTVSGSPVTTSGTLSATLANQTTNLVFASPNGSTGAPSFRALVAGDLPAGTGTVTSVSVASANGFAGTVANPTTTPALTLSTTITGILKGNGTAISAAVAGTDYVIPSGSITGTASNITATSNSTLTTLSALSLPYSQVTGKPTLGTAAAAATTDFDAAGAASTAQAASLQKSSNLSDLGSAATARSNLGLGSAALDLATADLMFFGNKQDSDLSISSGTTSLVRDMYYDTLTISGTAIFKPVGFIAFCWTLDATNLPAGGISTNGQSGSIGGATGIAGTAGGASASGSIAGNVAAGAGGASSATVGAGGVTASSNSNTGMGGGSGGGGAGGTGAGGAGGSAGTSAGAVAFNLCRLTTSFFRGASLLTGGSGGAGGGAGGGDGTLLGGGGGGGASGPGPCIIFARTLIRGASTAAGAITASGATGGAGGTPTGATATGLGGGGGGCGSGGGWIFLVYKFLSGSVATNMLSAGGGAGGNGGAAKGTGTAGAGGRSGAQGRITIIDLTAQTITDNVGATSTFGTASGATGAAAIPYQVSL